MILGISVNKIFMMLNFWWLDRRSHQESLGAVMWQSQCERVSRFSGCICLLTHLPYSPDLAPGDFYLFGRLESDLQGKWTMTPSSRLFGSGYTTNHKPFLKRASGCFQNGKNVLTPEGSTLTTDMCE
jgi:hypothetical protein